jgi:hypothetical protein
MRRLSDYITSNMECGVLFEDLGNALSMVCEVSVDSRYLVGDKGKRILILWNMNNLAKLVLFSWHV